MNRRGFLQCLGAFAAAAYIPACSERIIRAPAWWKGEVTVYRTAAPLAAGNYTFTAYAGELGIYIGGFSAKGGESLFEIPATTHPMDNPRIKLGGLVTPQPTREKSVDFCDQSIRDALIRGDSVRPT